MKEFWTTSQNDDWPSSFRASATTRVGPCREIADPAIEALDQQTEQWRIEAGAQDDQGDRQRQDRTTLAGVQTAPRERPRDDTLTAIRGCPDPAGRRATRR